MESVKDELVFIKSLMKGVSALFGKNCEVVLHDLKDQPYETTIIAIENGHVTGRTVGDCGTNLGLEVLRGTDASGDRYNYATQTKSGHVLRSSSIYLKNANGEVIGSLCINFDVTDMMFAQEVINSVCMNPLVAQDSDSNEVFANDVNELMDTLIQESQQQVNKPVPFMTKDDKLKALRYLDLKGAFLIKKSGDKIAKYYDISKYTMYSYLEEIRAE
ncbi:MAG: helix-turn-helix transcriptional regulator [Deferribacteraceae bacterium]|jgi:predicted transcriptional regulator YheO|nr:helix-turn-helix transcriptional regulator [Deferribacteraceae bacterium]